MEKLKIIVCTHKADDRIRNYAPYVPVHGGKALHPDIDLGFIGDDTGDNISEKNPLSLQKSALHHAISSFLHFQDKMLLGDVSLKYPRHQKTAFRGHRQILSDNRQSKKPGTEIQRTGHQIFQE